MVTRVLLVALYSPKQPAVCESLAISTLGACLDHVFGPQVGVKLLNLYAIEGDRRECLLDTISHFAPHILGCSVVYGSFDWLREIYPVLLRAWRTVPRLSVFGGSVATYAPEQLIELVDSEAIVVLGEGDEALVEIVNRFREGLSYQGIPNTYMHLDGRLHIGPKKLVDLSKVPPPNRSLTSTTMRIGGQIFAESSRGCTWGSCQFCGRGITDIAGGHKEYRRFPVERVVTDLQQLRDLGVTAVSFADEEFLGHLDNDVLNWLEALRDALHERDIQLRIDINLMVNSVILSRWDQHERQKRRRIWDTLQEIGLRKVFIGIESGSNSQLRRYNKGVTADQNLEAISIISERGIELEAGFIMFDPLCAIRELLENIAFVRDNGIAGFISSLDNELRVQRGSQYYWTLFQEEQRRGVQLLEKTFDRSILIYPSLYLERDVQNVVAEVRIWRSRWGKFHYAIKAISRYGEQDALRSIISKVRSFAANLKNMYLQHFEDLVLSAAKGDTHYEEIRRAFYSDLATFARKALAFLPELREAGISKSHLRELEDGIRKAVGKCTSRRRGEF